MATNNTSTTAKTAAEQHVKAVEAHNKALASSVNLDTVLTSLSIKVPKDVPASKLSSTCVAIPTSVETRRFAYALADQADKAADAARSVSLLMAWADKTQVYKLDGYKSLKDWMVHTYGDRYAYSTLAGYARAGKDVYLPNLEGKISTPVLNELPPSTIAAAGSLLKDLPKLEEAVAEQTSLNIAGGRKPTVTQRQIKEMAKGAGGAGTTRNRPTAGSTSQSDSGTICLKMDGGAYGRTIKRIHEDIPGYLDAVNAVFTSYCATYHISDDDRDTLLAELNKAKSSLLTVQAVLDKAAK